MKKIIALVLFNTAVLGFTDQRGRIRLDFSEEYYAVKNGNEKAFIGMQTNGIKTTLIALLQCLHFEIDEEADDVVRVCLEGEPMARKYQYNDELFSGARIRGDVSLLKKDAPPRTKEMNAVFPPPPRVTYLRSEEIPNIPEKAPFEDLFNKLVLPQIIDFFYDSFGFGILKDALNSGNEIFARSLIMTNALSVDPQLPGYLVEIMKKEISDDRLFYLNLWVYSEKDKEQKDFLKVLCQNNRTEVIGLFELVEKIDSLTGYYPLFFFRRICLMKPTPAVQSVLKGLLRKNTYNFGSDAGIWDFSEYEKYKDDLIGAMKANGADDELLHLLEEKVNHNTSFF